MHILFICTGNVCRSPMAEGLFRDAVKAQDKLTCESAGVAAGMGQPASRHSVSVMKELGIDISDLRSQPVTAELVAKADMILGMTYTHLDSMLLLFPQSADKLFLLREFMPEQHTGSREVDDPIGQSEEVYRRTRDQIRAAVNALVKALGKAQASGPGRSPGGSVLLGGEGSCKALKAAAAVEIEKAGLEIREVAKKAASLPVPEAAGWIARELQADPQLDAVWVMHQPSAMAEALACHPGVRVRVAGTGKDVFEADENVLLMDAGALTAPEASRIVSNWLSRTPHQIETTTKHSMKTTNEAPVAEPTLSALAATDVEIHEAVLLERKRQQSNIELIASENFTSRAVMEAQGSCLTNKYAEGYPAKRWYGGCEHVDVVETLAIERAKQLFGAEHANVQPHAGSQANMAVYFAFLKPGDKILTMDLSHGGHLTHGHPMNFSGKLYEVMHYGVSRETETLDYDDLERKAQSFKPAMITVGASAYSRVIDFERMGKIARSVGALLMADIAHISGLVAAGVHPSPVPHADFVTTTTHKTLRGPRSGLILCKEKYAKEIDAMVFPGCQGGPLMHVIAAKAVCFKEALQPGFKEYAGQVVRNAKALCEGMKKNGYRIVSGTTENHVMLVDLQPLSITGKDASAALDHAGITVNKNAIPFDTQSPFKAGGIRLGTPAVTTRGMKEEDMFQIADWIHEAIQNREDQAALADICKRVHFFTANFPLP